MPMSMEKLEAEALHLDLHARAELAGRLIISLDEPTVDELERLWLDEAERRLKDYRAGKSQGIPAEDVFARAFDDIA